VSLGLMARAGLPVPPGFCITTSAHIRARASSTDQPSRPDEDLRGQILQAYQALGGGRVAVRSSATDEDGTATSFAGQQETFLGVEGEDAVCDALAGCWASLDSGRARAYREQVGLAADGSAMAVVVQRLVEAEVAGVLFTRDPLDPEGEGMLVEASWGLGDSVVSGRVTPDRFHLDRATGAVRERHLGAKTTETTPTGPHTVSADRQEAFCLDEEQLARLAELGRAVEELFGGPRDVEWAWADGQFWLLQARPITAITAAEREEVRQEEIASLRARAEPAGTVWARFNLCEVLPEPTPMTWAIVRRLLAGRGGFGAMYRDLGFKPHPSLDEEGVYDLVAGQPYCNLSREPRFYSGWVPTHHPFAKLKADPARALHPRPVQNPGAAGPLFWLTLPVRLPFLFAGAVLFHMRLANFTTHFAERFRHEIIPPFREEVARAAREALTSLSPQALLDRLEHWTRRTLHDFARDSLKPTVLARLAADNVLRLLARKMAPARADEAVRELAAGVRPELDADLPAALADLAAGRLDRSAFLERHGHRGSGEMELANPRWVEDPASLERLMTGGSDRETASEPAAVWEAVAAEAGLSTLERTALDPQVRAWQSYQGLRETGKHHLMAGYAEIRRTLVELDRRYHLQGGIFYLTPDELPALIEGTDFSGPIEKRKRRRRVALSLEAPPVLFSDDLEALGRPNAGLPMRGTDLLEGVALSAGVAEAPAVLLDEPRAEGLPPEYVLVCPSTDPAWVPLLARGARALVMETGGVLSHGAIVAREFGLPAVAGPFRAGDELLPRLQGRLRDGQRLRIDGGKGTVTLLPE
jgi:phosphohistidine swiveling domain-containing protein